MSGVILIHSIIYNPPNYFRVLYSLRNRGIKGAIIGVSGSLDIVLDSYLGTYSSKRTPLKITFTEKNDGLTVELPNYPKFSVQPVADAVDTFESTRAGLRFVFNKTGLNMTILENSQVMEFTKE